MNKNFIRIISVILVVGGISLWLSQCSQKGSQLVAIVGGRYITVDQFIKSFSIGKDKSKLAETTMEQRLSHLNRLIDENLKIIYGYQNNLQENLEQEQGFKDQKEDLLRRHAINKLVIEPIIPESEIKKYYRKTDKTVKISEIVLLNSTQSKEDLLNKISTIKEALKNGTEFSQLARKYSYKRKSDASQPDNHERVITWSPLSSQSPINQKVFTMKVGQVSDTIKVKEGYTIFKVLDIKKVKPEPYDEIRSRFLNQLMEQHQAELDKQFYSVLDKTKSKFHLQFNDENIKIFRKVISDSSDTSKVDPRNYGKAFARFSDEQKKLSLVKYDNGGVTVGQLVDVLTENLRRPQFNLSGIKEIQTTIMQYIASRDLYLLEAKTIELDKDSQVEQELKDLTERYIRRKVDKVEIDDKIQIKDEDLLKYYEQHKEEYKSAEQREIQEIIINDKILADKVYKMAKSGQNFASLAKRYNQDPTAKNKEGKTSFITQNTIIVGAPVFAAKVGDIVGPINRKNDYIILKVLSVKKEGYRAFEDIKNFLQNKLSKDVRQQRSTAFVSELRNKIQTIIYENRLKDLFSEQKMN
jgi:parvulin-like peptidyl-prolyl isomerase